MKTEDARKPHYTKHKALVSLIEHTMARIEIDHGYRKVCLERTSNSRVGLREQITAVGM